MTKDEFEDWVTTRLPDAVDGLPAGNRSHGQWLKQLFERLRDEAADEAEDADDEGLSEPDTDESDIVIPDNEEEP